MIKTFGIVGVFAVLLGGCAAQEKQTQTGTGTDDYKQSPCACMPVQMLAPDDAWRSNIKRWQQEEALS